MKYIIPLLLLINACYPLLAQDEKGNELYDNFGYSSAAEEYQNMEESELTYEIKEKLANSFRLNSQFETAEYWYAQIIQEATNPSTILNYAQVLQSNDKCEDAIRWYKAYQEQDQDSQRSFIEDCKDLEKVENHKQIEVENLSSLNSDKHDFSPIPYKNGLVFTSMREGENDLVDQWTNSSYSDLYFIEKNGTSFSKPIPLEGDVNGQFHDGVATFDPIRNEMIFTRNTAKKNKEQEVKNLEIFVAKKKDKEWKEPTKLFTTDETFSSCHPTLSDNGQRLYFSSSRPGGFGGMDIYVVERTGNTWGIPTNLGPTVNTAGNELFPFISIKEKLFFASDGHIGLGGLDIFVVEKSKETDEMSWIERKNIGKPFNSKKDDFGFYIDSKEESGYLSSNRKGGLGADDIYSWSKSDKANKEEEDLFNPNPDNSFGAATMHTLSVCDGITKEPLEQTKVAILKVADNWMAYQVDSQLPTSLVQTTRNGAYSVQVSGGILRADASLTTNKEGAFDYFFHPKQTYAIFAEKDFYAPAQLQLTGLEINQKNTCIFLEKRTCIPVRGKVINKKFGTSISGVSIDIVNHCTGETYTVQTDRAGQFEQCLACDCAYDITANKLNFKENHSTISTQNTPCSTDKLIETTIALEIKVLNTNNSLSNEYGDPYSTGGTSGTGVNSGTEGNSSTWGTSGTVGTSDTEGTSGSWETSDTEGTSDSWETSGEYDASQNNALNPDNLLSKEYLNQYFTGATTSNYEVGQILTLNNIYYDFDNSDIRNDAGYELDFLVALLNQHPSMEISLFAHTDSRGEVDYNRWLSRARVKSAKDYLVEKGITSSRIHHALGFGETRPSNHCKDDVECSEEEHQKNRRTEVKIESYQEPLSTSVNHK